MSIEAAIEHVAVGQTVSLSAVVRDERGMAVPSAAVAWNSSDSDVASIAPDGSLTGHREGSTVLTVEWDGIRSDTVVEVRGFLIGPEGGEARTADGRAVLTFPPGALDEPVVITVGGASESDLAGLPNAVLVPGTAYVLGPSGQTFGADVELSFSYDPASLPSGIDESRLVIARATDGAWVRLGDSGPDRRIRKVKGKTRRFSVYAIVDFGNDEPPVATITSPPSGTSVPGGTSVTFAASAADAEDGSLTGDALTWTSDLDGPIGTGGTFSIASLSPGVHTIVLTAMDSSGQSATAEISLTVTNDPPSAAIASPGSGISVNWSTSLNFAGSALDPEEGALSGGALAWTSDLDGIIGTGTSFSTDDLSIGVHTITLTATDSNGASGADEITLVVLNNSPVAAITSPPGGLLVTLGALVTFQGIGSDVEDGPLTGGSLAWSSDLDGSLGAGLSLSIGSLSLGLHTITLTATDSAGATDSEQITITVL